MGTQFFGMALSPGSQHLALRQRHGPLSPLLGVSLVDLSSYLDTLLGNPQAPVERDAPSGVTPTCRHIPMDFSAPETGTSSERYLETPAFFIGSKGHGFSVTQNTEMQRQIAEKLSRLREERDANDFCDEVTRGLDWIVTSQLALIQYLTVAQKAYLESGMPLDLNALELADIAEVLDYTKSTVSRLMKNLTVRLPDGQSIFAIDLAPGRSLTKIKALHALRLLSQDPKYFEHGQWKVSGKELARILRSRFDILLKGRTVRQYKALLSQERETPLNSPLDRREPLRMRRPSPRSQPTSTNKTPNRQKR